MKNTKNNIHWKLLLTVFIVVTVIGMFLIYQLNKPKKSTGSKNVTLEVVDDTGNSKTYQENTDAEYLKDFMDELTTKTDFTYNGTSSNYGMFIDTVNNVKADYSTTGTYWAIYVNGEYGQYGIDQQTVSDKDVFKLAVEKAK